MRLINLLLFLILLGGCNVEGDDFVLSGQVIQIQFTDQILPGDWFKLDNLEFNHILNDTTDLLNQPEMSHWPYFENQAPEFIEKGYLPISKLVFQVQGARNTEKVPAGRVAGMFIQRLYQKQSNLKDGDLIYQVGQAEFLILGGKVFVKRSDDKPIRVTSNSVNGIYFNSLSEEDELYKDLFKNKS